MATQFQRFIGAAQNRLVPNQTNVQLLNSMLPELIPVVDLTAQAYRMEWAQQAHTMVAAVRPVFTLPEVPEDEIHFYHSIGYHAVTAGGTPGIVLSVAYPGITDDFQETYGTDAGNAENILTTSNASSSRAQRNGRPFIVYPRGILSVSQTVTAAIADVIRLQVIREVRGGPNSSNLVNGLITDTEQ